MSTIHDNLCETAAAPSALNRKLPLPWNSVAAPWLAWDRSADVLDEYACLGCNPSSDAIDSDECIHLSTTRVADIQRDSTCVG